MTEKTLKPTLMVGLLGELKCVIKVGEWSANGFHQNHISKFR